jgi:hypothetical protein
MPRSYLASKPAPNPQLSGFLTWTKSDFAAILADSNEIAALAGIDREHELVVIYRPLPIKSPAGDFIAIAGNMSNEQSEPAFIKINEDCIGSSFAIQNHLEIPLAIRSEIPLPAELLRDTSWNEAPEDIALAVFPNLVPIPFGAVIPDGITPGDEFFEVFQAISTEHGEWAKLITEQIEQSESDNEHVTIFKRIIDARILRGERDPARAATRGIRTAVIPATNPFIETSRIGNKFPTALAILRTDFMRNPTPARVELGASDDESYPEVFIGVQPSNAGHVHQPHQQPVAPQQQPQMPQQPPPQPRIYQHGPPLVTNALQQPQQPLVQQQPPLQLPMQQLPHQLPLVGQPPLQFQWQIPAYQQAAAPIPENPGFTVQNWQTQPMIFRSEAENESKQAAKLQTDILKLFFTVGKCDWEETTITEIRPPALTQTFKNVLDATQSVQATQFGNLCRTVFNEIPENEVDLLNPLYTNMSMLHFSKHFITGILNARFQYTNLGGNNYESTDINLFHFAPQNDSDLVSRAIQGDANARNEEDNLVPDSHRTKGKTVIEGIGRVNLMSDVVKVCANFCAVMRAIVDIEQGKPFLYSLMVKMILVIQHPDFQRWRTNNKRSLEHLHFNFMQKLHQVFTKLASFSSNSKNTHAVKHNVERPELHLKDINSAIKLASTFFEKMQENIDNETTTGLDVPAFANVLTAPPLAAKRSQHPSNVGDETTNHRNHDYRGNQGNDQDFRSNQDFDSGGNKRTKKERLPRTNLGLFHAKPGSEQGLFPRLKGKPPCNKFCVQGKTCDKLRQICKFAHVASWKAFEKDDQEAILVHADKTGNIWFDEATFKNQKVEIPQKYQYLLGDANGPKPKFTNSA